MSEGVPKRATGVPGLDEVTRGGLPAGGTTFVMGQPGAGKTVLGMQILARAQERGETGLFVAFEESSEQILRHASSFRWGGSLRNRDGVRVIDARPRSDAVAAGSFDVEGLIAMLGHAAGEIDASWIVLDGIDQLLTLEPEEEAALAQVRRLNEWCEERGLTTLLTGKQDAPGGSGGAIQAQGYLRGVEFMLSTVLVLSATLVERRLNRRFRIAKYRGSGHVTDELPLVLDEEGVHLPYGAPAALSDAAASTERVGVGIARLDDILGGGVYRGSTTLVSGAPGTSKTTLAASFVAAAAQRGERALMLSFDELSGGIVRNVASVGIELRQHIEAGRLRVESRAAWAALVEEHFMEVHRLLDVFRPDVLVIDPVSALLKATSAETAYLSTERILTVTRDRSITTLLTSLVAGEDPGSEATLSHTSTLADTWITLDYQVRAGERNRALSVVKSRGTAHSNQVRELVLSRAGIDLMDVYQYGSEVLMGTARMQKESEEAARERQLDDERERRLSELHEKLERVQVRSREAERESAWLRRAIDREAEVGRAADDHDERHRREVVDRRSGSGPWAEAEHRDDVTGEEADDA